MSEVHAYSRVKQHSSSTAVPAAITLAPACMRYNATSRVNRREVFHADSSPDCLTVTLHAVAGDPRPVEVRWRQALKSLLRQYGLRASWPTREVHAAEDPFAAGESPAAICLPRAASVPGLPVSGDPNLRDAPSRGRREHDPLCPLCGLCGAVPVGGRTAGANGPWGIAPQKKAWIRQTDCRSFQIFATSFPTPVWLHRPPLLTCQSPPHGQRASPTPETGRTA